MHHPRPGRRRDLPVRSVEPESITTSSSTSGAGPDISSRRITDTILPTVAASFRAGSTTLTCVPCFAAASRPSGRSAADQDRRASQRSTSSST